MKQEKKQYLIEGYVHHYELINAYSELDAIKQWWTKHPLGTASYVSLYNEKPNAYNNPTLVDGCITYETANDKD